jgi:hypothetical protein
VAWLNSWLDAIADTRAANAARDPVLHRLVEERERLLKGTKSRFVNDRLLANWRGGAGVGRLTYRWDTVRRQLDDIFEGLDSAGP